MCKLVDKIGRRSATSADTPSHDPYIPRSHSLFYNCSSLECEPILLTSLTQVTSPNLNLKACYREGVDSFNCDKIRYNYFKNIDKLLFLKNNVENKTFYLVDCLVYSDRGRICHKKNDVDSHADLVDIGTLVRPEEPNVLSQEEFLCEENDNKEVNCDLDPFIPYDDGLKVKDHVKIKGNVLLKSGTYAITLKWSCKEAWCGYSGELTPTRRTWYERYDPPGGKVYRCYYAKRQQICKELYGLKRQVDNERTWLET